MGRKMKHTEIGDIPIDWEIQTFEETFQVLSNNTLSRENLNNKGGAVRNIHYGDILTKFPEVLNCNEEDIPYLNDLSLINANTQLLQDGDIVIADTAEDETVGKTIEVQNLGDGKLVAGLHTIPCRVKKGDFAPGWLGYYMNSHIYHDQIIPFITGIKVSSISKTAIAETIILIPPIDEQKRIIEVLSEIDLVLKAEQSIIDKLKNFKSGCLDSIFPREKDCVPNIRFCGFTDDWQRNSLDNLSEVKDSARIPNNQWSEKGIPYIRASDLSNETLSGVLFIPADVYEYYKNQTGAPQKGDVLFNGGGEIGKAILKKDNHEIYVQGGAVLYAQTSKSKKLLGSYLSSFFESPYARKYIEKVQSGGTMKHFTLKPAKEMPILFSSIEEQKQVGDYFDSLYMLIVLHKCKYEKYNSIKTGLISKLISMK